MKWQPIQDLSSEWQQMASQELPPLVTVWEEQAECLRDSGTFKTFKARMQRQIAIETGVIEWLYNIDRDITRLLIEQGINASLIPHGTTDRPIQQVVALIQDQEAAIEGLFDFVGRKRSLSTSYIKELHQLLTRNQPYTETLVPSTGEIISVPLIRGDWKKQPNNLLKQDDSIHEYCPPEQVASEMDNLIRWHHQHQKQNVTPEVEAAWFHHRFTQIHPFQDGNGRVVRCLASLIFIQAKWFPLVLTRDNRVDYILSLEQADKGDISGLINLFAQSQRQLFIRSLGLSEQVLAERRSAKIIVTSIAEKLKKRQTESLQEKLQKSEYFATILVKIAYQRLDDLKKDIELSVEKFMPDAEIFMTQSYNQKTHYHRYQVLETAKKQGYFANFSSYHKWIQLVINIETPVIILASFHVLGRENIGLLVCSICAHRKDNTEEAERKISDIQPLTDSPFQFSYADDEENLVQRFCQWLENAVVAGVEYWNQGL